MQTRSIQTDASGWLRVTLEDKRIVSLPKALKVLYESTVDRRDYFKILEGSYNGLRGSVQRGVNNNSWLGAVIHYRAPAQLTFKKQKQQLWLGSHAYVKAITDPSNPLPNGMHDIEIPDFPHDLGRTYVTASPVAMSWFRIGHMGDRYLHAGSVSLGCLTVTNVNGWTAVFNQLIGCRKGDGKSIGTVRVEN